MSFVSEALIIGGVALDLVGATALSHAHNAESALELREEIGEDEHALGEKDAIATHAQLLSEKRVGFLILAFGLLCSSSSTRPALESIMIRRTLPKSRWKLQRLVPVSRSAL